MTLGGGTGWVGETTSLHSEQHGSTCCFLTKHLPLLLRPPEHRLWDGSTSFHQGWGWHAFSNVPLHCKRADDISWACGVGMYQKLQDSRCSSLVVNSVCCYIGEMMYQAAGTATCVTSWWDITHRAELHVLPHSSACGVRLLLSYRSRTWMGS